MTISGGGVREVEPKKISGSLSLAMTPVEHTSNFYPDVTVYLQVEYLKKWCVLGTKLLKKTIGNHTQSYLMIPLSVT